ncbi:HdeD family acid-resistance protein [Microbacterium kunmingense]|uniref:HdeD family acid-resistance protein n=1 Tax=Microbacterium kunmingense TaxID=2915939 RepID=UPI002006691D|nr:DUF308 domain-containing protein [Microbacterium kunmingense]
MSTGTGEKSLTNTVRVALGVVGAIALIFGLLILIWPEKTFSVITWILAVYAIIAGLVYIGLGAFSRERGGWSRIGYIVLGVLFVIAGIVAIANIASAASVLLLLVGLMIGITWVVEGIVSLSTLSDTSSKGWTIFFAIISIVAGVVVMFAPIWGALIVWLFFGVSLVILGIIQIVRALRFGRI